VFGVKYIYAALLLYESGKEINEDNLKKIFEAIGEEADSAMIKSLVSSLNSINIKEVLESAVTMPTTAQPAAPQPAVVEEEKKEEKVEEEEEEEKEEEALEGLGALFG
jgi:large subunit ribosomal protein L12